jgi:superfamily II DNA or RNA helicase
VEVRGRPWFLRAQVARADCQELHLEPATGHRGASPHGPVVLLAPFDRPVPISRPGRIRTASRRAWMAELRTAILGQRIPGTLVAAAGAGIDLLPHQLEPALAVVAHGVRRLLLADAVGLGKTIEAGLVLAELRARSMLDRALVLAPPGLCDQWCAELSGRFGLDAAVADAGWLRGLRPILPRAINPWTIPGIRIASLDFAKRPEVRRGIEQVSWDAVVVDEAHAAAGDSDRRAAAHAFATRARFVLLLTATPHNGNPRGFHALCRIGALTASDAIVMFRRTREDAGISRRRRVHLHRLQPAEAERAVRRELERYIRMVWAQRTGPEGRDARLAMIVLLKRSLSGMGPLRRSLLARLERLGTPPVASEVQLPLLWEAEDEADASPSAVLAAAGLDDQQEERRVLRSVAALAAAAEAHDSKRRALVRVLSRLREPAIVFTEYRDTLDALRGALDTDTVLLHGAMDRFERAAAVQRFNGGGARLLLATDAAGEGLNLQRRCRLVINLELPWNPMRLEQRIGRVDRIGQLHTVHVINLLASGTAETDILDRLARRLDSARRDVGAVDEVLGRSDEGVIAACLGLGEGSGMASRREPARQVAFSRHVRRLDLGNAAGEAVARLERRRRLLRARAARTSRRRTGGILVTSVRGSRLSFARCRTGLLAVFRVAADATGSLAGAGELGPVFAAGPCPPMRRRQDVQARGVAAMASLIPAMAASIPPRAPDIPHGRDEFSRDAQLEQHARRRRTVQRGLFDRRALREAEAIEAEGRADPNAGTGGRPLQVAEPVLLLFLTS